MAGEAVSSKEVQTWSPMLTLLAGYGPTECAVWCSGTLDKMHPGSEPRSLGRPFGCRMWIVEPGNLDLLVPLGAVGELVVEGPNIARGYLDELSTTQAAFVDGPRPWLDDGKPSRIYRTGDMVRYATDGTLLFIGRKDRQVKLRGQRLELAEVEHHLRQVFVQAQDTVAEVASACNETKLLVAFIHLPDISTTAENDKDSLIAPATDSFRSSAQAGDTKLRTRMPGYMVPTLYLPLKRVPLTISGKLDRRRLCAAVSAITITELEAYSAPITARTEPSTPAEQRLQQIWSDVLNRPVSTIGVEDNFFRLGGDSIRAMSLISAAREGGYSINIADVFQNPTIRDLARAMCSTTDEAVISVNLAPFVLVADSSNLIEIAAKRCSVSLHQIEDIYPCTPLQEGLMALSTKFAHRYKVTFRYQLDVQVDLNRFQSSWLSVAAVNPILRTRMIQSSHHPGTYQVVLMDAPRFHLFDRQAGWDEHIRASPMTLGHALVDFSLMRHGDSAAMQFCLTMHHAVYDGWTLPLLWKQVETYYRCPQSIPPPPPFNRFIDYIQRQFSRAAKYWRNELSGASAPVWPSLPSARHTPVADAYLHHTITGLCCSGSEYTTTTFIHLAWALVMSSQTDSDDLVYGVTLNGRGAPITGMKEMTGPTFTSFPLRIRLRLDRETVDDALSAIQQQATNRIPFQQFGLQNIRNTSPDAGQACQFQSYLAIQDHRLSQEHTSLFAEVGDGHVDYGAFAEYAFTMVCHLDGTDSSCIQVVVNYDPQVVLSSMAKRVLGQFSHLLQQLPKNLQTPLGQLDILSPGDKHQLSVWNGELPLSSDVCLHDLVFSHSNAAPDAAAICAWDGNVTYVQLVALSRQLAGQLRLLGVHRGTLVPLCLEKSKWAAITMLAVLEAGGACVPLDPSHPLTISNTLFGGPKLG